MTPPLVSVVIPTHNRADRLPRALGTALGQEGVSHEVVVVVDGSTDGTSAYLALETDSRLRVVTQTRNQGLCAARNAGAAAARGRWLAFLDDDDLWSPAKLRAQLDALAAAPEASWCAVGSVTVDDDLEITGWKPPPAPRGVARGLAAQNVVPGGGSGVIVRTAMFEEVGGFDPALSLAGDRDLWIRLAARSPVACVDRPLVGYVLHGANLSTLGQGYEAELRALERKYRRRPERATAYVPRASLAARAGRRAAAVGLLVQAAAVHRDVRHLARATVHAAGPAAERTARRLQAARLPGAWRTEAEEW